jgi:hypothetical protein
MIQQARDAGINNSVMDIRAVTGVAQNSLIDEPLELV